MDGEFKNGFEKVAQYHTPRRKKGPSIGHIGTLLAGGALGAGLGLGLHRLSRDAIAKAGKYIVGGLGLVGGLKAGHKFYNDKQNRKVQREMARSQWAMSQRRRY